MGAQSQDPRAALSAGEWETVQLRGSWRVGQTAGGSRNFASFPSNPCFPLLVPEGAGPRCVRISLHQHCPDGDCHPIGFHVFQASSLEQDWAEGPWGLCPRRWRGVTWRPGLGHKVCNLLGGS